MRQTKKICEKVEYESKGEFEKKEKIMSMKKMRRKKKKLEKKFVSTKENKEKETPFLTILPYPHLNKQIERHST